ncbi:unnamed protein product [Timema podura]|uniref:Vacuolar protein sorting-associated protein 13 DH-like domain-containing protein n=1 Tax=Timema podura TaxID=61482 RepID=A0ABN7P5P6_TIMPD|nr:unnamed protein product [Timema podura]
MFDLGTFGAHQEGVEGFFKGVGKGLMGLMTKPTGGVLDCIAMALDGIKRASEMGEDVTMRMRLPRYMNPLLLIRSVQTRCGSYKYRPTLLERMFWLIQFVSVNV